MTDIYLMEDSHLVEMYFNREEDAIIKTSEKYGVKLRAVANNILGDSLDADECVNDTYLKAWDTIPPNRPTSLFAYLGKIARNLAFDKYRHSHAEKRGGGNMPLVLEELSECVASNRSVEGELTARELGGTINRFLDTLPEDKCKVFVLRYWYAMPVSDIAKRFGKSEGNISVMLNRIRSKLSDYLNERGYAV